MKIPLSPTQRCHVHSTRLNRDDCSKCNPAYVRDRQLHSPRARPDAALVKGLQYSAEVQNLPFGLTPNDVVTPATWPLPSYRMVVGRTRSAMSPSIDRIQPHLGYVPGRVRVVSDRAKRSKGTEDQPQLQLRATRANGKKYEECRRLAQHVDRELILAEVRAKAAAGGRAGEIWEEIGRFLNKAYMRADWIH